MKRGHGDGDGGSWQGSWQRKEHKVSDNDKDPPYSYDIYRNFEQLNSLHNEPVDDWCEQVDEINGLKGENARRLEEINTKEQEIKNQNE